MYTLIISGVLFVLSITILILNSKLWYKDIIRQVSAPIAVVSLALVLFCSVFASFMSRDRYTVKREELVYKLGHMSIDQKLYREYENFNECIDIINAHWLSFETEDCNDLYINIRDYLGD